MFTNRPEKQSKGKEGMKITGSIPGKVKQSLKAAEGRYYKLVLLVGEPGSGKSTVLRDVANELAIPIINVNLELSLRLLDLTPKQRTFHFPKLLEEITETNNSILVLDHLELLFDKEMKQDPLRLLQKISRNHSIVASWNGSLEYGRLMYAVMGHPEYRNYDNPDALIVRMDGAATIDSAK